MTRSPDPLRLVGTLALSGLAAACGGQPAVEAQQAAAATTAATPGIIRNATNLGDAPSALLQPWAYVENTTFYGYENGSTPFTEPAQGALELWPTGRYEKAFVLPDGGMSAPTRETGRFVVRGNIVRFVPDRGAPYAQRYELDAARMTLRLTDAEARRDGEYRRQTLRVGGTGESPRS